MSTELDSIAQVSNETNGPLVYLTGVDAGIVYDDCSNREQAVLALYERDRVVNTVIQDAVQL